MGLVSATREASVITDTPGREAAEIETGSVGTVVGVGTNDRLLARPRWKRFVLIHVVPVGLARVRLLGVAIGFLGGCLLGLVLITHLRPEHELWAVVGATPRVR